jgi:hypothetical protein
MGFSFGAPPSDFARPAGKVAGIEIAAGQREVESGTEREDRIVQDARAAKAPQQEGGNAQQEGRRPSRRESCLAGD